MSRGLQNGERPGGHALVGLPTGTGSMGTTKDLVTRAKDSVRLSVKLATYASIFVLLRSLLGSPSRGEIAFVGALVLWYFGSAVVGGSIYGLSLGWRTTRGRSVLFGAIAAMIPFALLVGGLHVAGNPLGLTAAQAIKTTVVSALIWGGMFGWHEWTYRDDKPFGRPRPD